MGNQGEAMQLSNVVSALVSPTKKSAVLFALELCILSANPEMVKPFYTFITKQPFPPEVDVDETMVEIIRAIFVNAMENETLS